MYCFVFVFRPRSEVPRSSSTARSASSNSLSSNTSSHPRPTSQPNFNSHQLQEFRFSQPLLFYLFILLIFFTFLHRYWCKHILTKTWMGQDLDPWDTAEQSATAPPPPSSHSHSKPGPGWTVFPDNSPAAAPRAAWGNPKPSKSSAMYPNINNNAFNNGYKRFALCTLFSLSWWHYNWTFSVTSPAEPWSPPVQVPRPRARPPTGAGRPPSALALTPAWRPPPATRPAPPRPSCPSQPVRRSTTSSLRTPESLASRRATWSPSSRKSMIIGLRELSRARLDSSPSIMFQCLSLCHKATI